VVASTTSTDQSGLFGFILPEFEAASGIKVNVVALGSALLCTLGHEPALVPADLPTPQ
jgi:tungstate transport system substrate-binding protein